MLKKDLDLCLGVINFHSRDFHFETDELMSKTDLDLRPGSVTRMQSIDVYFESQFSREYDSLDALLADARFIDDAVSAAKDKLLSHLKDGLLCSRYPSLIDDRSFQDDAGTWNRVAVFNGTLRDQNH